MYPIPQFVRHAGRALAAVLAASVIMSPTQGGGGVTGTGFVAYGEVTDFGSVFVNGIEFFTQSANVIIDGVSNRSESELRIGMPVRVDGVLNPDGRTGNASTVTYSADLRGIVDGPATSSDDEGALFFIHGLAVRVDEYTVFESLAGPRSLAAGDRVEASGLRDDETGELYATYVSRGTLSAGTVVSGAISETGASSFRLGSLTVQYDAMALRNVPSGELANGMVVRVRADAAPVAGNLQATDVSVELESLAAVPGTKGSAEGIVSLPTPAGFWLGSLMVLVDERTQFRDGTAAGLLDGALVGVEGTVQAGGALLAERVSYVNLMNASAQAVVAATDATGFRLVSAEGVRVNVNSSTRFIDRSTEDPSQFGPGDLRVGDTVRVTGLEAAAGTILAERVMRIRPTNVVELRARSRSAVSPTAVLLAMNAVTGPSTVFRDEKGEEISQQAFFAKALGRQVRAKGLVQGSDSFVAATIDIES
ncbi:MAG TPA: DUF5666 domain-containing protein [Usitatibacteraceae bacterium]|nr:DUF5666 domain-containing protein [Usitatibacteraceae bacterium]